MATKKEPVNVGEELKAEAEKRYPRKNYHLAIRNEIFIEGANFALSQQNKEMEEMLASEDFYNLMQQYRIAPMENQQAVIEAFERVKQLLNRKK